MTSTTIRYKCLLCRCWKCEYIYIWKDFVSYCVVWIRHIYIKIFRKNPKMYIYFDFFFMFRTQAKFYLLKIDDISRFCRLPQFSRKRRRANDSSSAEVQPFMDEIFSKGWNAIYKSVEYDVNLFIYCEVLKHDRTNDVPSITLDIATSLYQLVKRKYILKWPGREGGWGT